MSRDNQRYSAENQAFAIAAYAERRGLTIVRSYVDKGKSGLTIKGRNGLQSLIDDVQAGQQEFDLLLVYDVSRWGRFQDADESAYYEFLCRRAGVPVIYCAEHFDNDGSPASVLIKSIKRAMAGEYSRELSAKTSAGQSRLIHLGFRQGGTPGIGLRRLLVDPSRTAKIVLKRGDQKSLQTDRVVLILGPPEEVATVKRIYRLYLDRGLSIHKITNLLNAEGLSTDLGRPYSYSVVHTVLTSEKYLGHNVYGKTSKKLRTPCIKNPKNEWVRADAVFPALIDEESFERVRAIIERRGQRLSKETMIEDLARLHRRLGKLSGPIIDKEVGIASAQHYRGRFGTLKAAYDLAGVYDARPSDGAMLEDLVRLHKKIGRLSWRRIDSAKGIACALTYHDRFGGLEAAYARAGIGDQRLTDEALITDLVSLYRRVGMVTYRTIALERTMASGRTYKNRFGSLGNARILAGIHQSRRSASPERPEKS